MKIFRTLKAYLHLFYYIQQAVCYVVFLKLSKDVIRNEYFENLYCLTLKSLNEVREGKEG